MPHNSKGFEAPKAVLLLTQAGQGMLQEEEIDDWLDEDASLPGHHHLTDQEIVKELTSPKPEKPEEEEQQQNTNSYTSGTMYGCS